MTSTTKQSANRRNAQLSTGPKTPDGKARVARNATTHGLSSGFTVLAHEDQAAFDRLLEANRATFKPTNEHETFLIELMTQSRWRYDRTRRFEALAFQLIIGEPLDETHPDAIIVMKLAEKSPNVLDLLHRYATAAEKSYYRAHRELTQARNREERNKATEAQLWLRQQLGQASPGYDPTRAEPLWQPPYPASEPGVPPAAPFPGDPDLAG